MSNVAIPLLIGVAFSGAALEFVLGKSWHYLANHIHEIKNGKKATLDDVCAALSSFRDECHVYHNSFSTTLRAIRDEFKAIHDAEYPVWLRAVADTQKTMGELQEPLDDLVRIASSRLDILVANSKAQLQETQMLLSVRDESLHEAKRASTLLVGLTAAVKEITPTTVNVTETDAKIPAAIDAMNVGVGVLKEEVANLSSLAKGLLEMAKSLAEVAHNLEKGNVNPYEEYAKRDRRGSMDERIVRLQEDFDYTVEEATQMVQGMRVK
jgi:formate-dependent nitrite reductase cytochrome c552 subunit